MKDYLRCQSFLTAASLKFYFVKKKFFNIWDFELPLHKLILVRFCLNSKLHVVISTFNAWISKPSNHGLKYANKLGKFCLNITPRFTWLRNKWYRLRLCSFFWFIVISFTISLCKWHNQCKLNIWKD